MTNLMEKDKDLHVDNKYDVHMSSMIYVDNGYGVDLDLLNQPVLIACFISYEKWVGWKKN